MARYSAIPFPQDDLESLRSAVIALKDIMEIITGQKGDQAARLVTHQDLVDLDLIDQDEIPTTPPG